MKYRFDNFVLDREGGILTRDGFPVHITWRALICITWLIEQRHRVVGNDELIRKVWGHGDATNHQLSQVVLAARRALGDDGQSQRLIRTTPNHGYRWLGAAVVETDTVVVSHAPLAMPDPGVGLPTTLLELPTSSTSGDEALASAETTIDPKVMSDTLFDAGPRSVSISIAAGDDVLGQDADDLQEEVFSATTVSPAGRLRVSPRYMLLGLAVFSVIAVVMIFRTEIKKSEAKVAVSSTSKEKPLEEIEELLWAGNTEEASRRLSTLPAALKALPEAKIMEIRMEIDRGYHDRAKVHFQAEYARSKAAGDIVLQARLLTLQSMNAAHSGDTAEEVMSPARESVAMLEAMPANGSQHAYGSALSARGVGFLFLRDFDSALRDLVRARDILMKSTDKRDATLTRRMLAHTQLRMGRLSDALEELLAIANDSRRWNDPLGETIARNTATRIQIEQLRWDDALANTKLAIEASERISDGFQRAATLRARALVLLHDGKIGDADALLERVDRQGQGGRATVAETFFYLTKGENSLAAAEALILFSSYENSDGHNLILQNQEGAMLLWTMAAHHMVRKSLPVQSLTNEQLQVLNHPKTIPAKIAKGWWLYSKGLPRDAEQVLRDAIREAADNGRAFYLTLAAEPLVELLLERGDAAAAREVLTDVRGMNPKLMDRDFRVVQLRLRIAHAENDAIEIDHLNRIAIRLAGERSIQVNKSAASEWLRLPSKSNGNGGL
jgi:DNA-binding winged helix-turn-helix (wHTH) protein